MAHVWRSTPQIKVEAGTTDISGDSLTVRVLRPENAISRVHLVANDKDGKNYIGNLDVFTVLKVSLRYGSDSWTQVFEGKVESVGPILDVMKGQTAMAVAYGYGRALRATHCNENFGQESTNSTLDTPTEIWDDLIDNHINLNFDGGATGYAITKAKIKTISTPVIQFIMGGYRKNIDVMNEVALVYQAAQAGSAGVHWFVDPSKNLWIDTIANHSVDVANWPTWWRTNAAGSTLEEGRDFVGSNFTKNVQNFANKIVLTTDLRKPAYDYWTEDSGGSALWAVNDCAVTDTNAAGMFVVGSHSLQIDMLNINMGHTWYPGGSTLAANAAAGQPDVTVTSATPFSVGQSVRLWDNVPTNENAVIQSIAGAVLTMTGNLTNAYSVANNAICSPNAGWDFTKIGSEESIPKLNFYFYKDADFAELTSHVGFFTTHHGLDYYFTLFSTYGDPDNEWIHRSIPIGPYWKSSDESRQFRWDITAGGVFDWANVNGIVFLIDGNINADLWIDDLHITGKIVREAYNSTSITANDEVQKTVQMQTSVNDMLKAADDTGTAARLAYAELLVAQKTPIVGQVTIPLAEDVLPGQLIHIHSDKQVDGSFRVDSDFRVQQIIHEFAKRAVTILDLTDDVVNIFAKGHAASPSANISALAKVMFTDPEAKSLKTTGIDTLVTRLSKDYP